MLEQFPAQPVWREALGVSIKIKKVWMSLSTPLTAILKHTKMRGQKTGLLSSLKREEMVVYLLLSSLSLLKAKR